MIYNYIFKKIPQTPTILKITNFKFNPLNQLTHYLYYIIKFYYKIFLPIKKKSISKI